MKATKSQLLEVKRALKEMDETNMLDSNELKVITKYVNGLGTLPALNRFMNDTTLIGLDKEINNVRYKIMDYVSENSNYKFTANGPNTWKLVKK